MLKTNDIIGQLSIGCRDAQKYFKSYEIIKNFLDNVLDNKTHYEPYQKRIVDGLGAKRVAHEIFKLRSIRY